MRILVFGAGALGQAIGGLLAAAGGHEVDLVVRDRYLEPLRREGITVTGIFGDHHAEAGSFGAFTGIPEIAGRRYDFVLLTVKSYDTAAALDALATLSYQDFTVVSLQNGCGNMEQIAQRFGTRRTLAGRVITGFEIEGPGHVRITVHADDIHIGGPVEGVSPGSVEIAHAISATGLPTVATTRIRMDLHAKLLYNCALNPLGAILGATYGELGENPASRAIMDAVIDEVYYVMRAMGIEALWSTPDEYRAYFYEKQIPATADHRSSMLQDLEAGKPTEVDAFTGYVAAMDRRHQVPTPVCDTLTNLVRFREQQPR